jgi:signal recognition particle subunit SRP54
MFSFLTDKLYKIYDLMKGVKSLDEDSLNSFFIIIKDNLVLADVPLIIIDNIILDLKQRLLGKKINYGIKPGEYLAKEFYAVILNLLQNNNKISKQKEILKNFVLESKKAKKPNILFLVGLQGAGKTTTVGKILYAILNNNPKLGIIEEDIAVISLDYDRPAAREQLRLVANTLKVESIILSQFNGAIEAAQNLNKMINNKEINKKIIIVDTAGRLVIDKNMMDELRKVYEILQPQEVFLTIDSMVSQEGVDIAKEFVAAVPCSGCIITKVDSDAPGGIILGITSLLSIPILYITIGEKPSDMKLFDPASTARRLIGMGEIMELAQEAQRKINKFEEDAIKESIKKGDISIDNFLIVLSTINKMGSIKNIISMLPRDMLVGQDISSNQMDSFDKFSKEFVIMANSMTKKERSFSNLIKDNEQRKIRIAKGAGININQAKEHISLFFNMRSSFKMLSKFL